MPPKKAQSVEVTISSNPKPAQARKKAKKSKSRPKSHSSSSSSSAARLPNPLQCPVVLDYLNCLKDPFRHPPVKLGLGCMVPTTLYTVYWRGLPVSNADGSLAIFLAPAVSGVTGGNAGVVINSSGIAGTTWTLSPWINVGLVAPLVGEARVIAAGIRVRPMVALTSTPGILYSGSIATGSSAQLTAATTQVVTQIPFLVPSPANFRGVSATTCPQDLSSYQFSPVTANYSNNTFVFTSSIPVIAATGWPASTPFYVEAVLHFEGMQIGTGASLIDDYNSVKNTDSYRDSILSYVPSLESLMGTVRKGMENPTVRHAASAGARAAAAHISRRAGFSNGLFDTAGGGPDPIWAEAGE